MPVALNNARLANGMHITKGKMRGEPSDGMFCGSEELGITKDYYEGADTDGVLVLSLTHRWAPTSGREVNIDDYVLDVNVTSNRQDCNSVVGLAREVAVALGKNLPRTADRLHGAVANTSDMVTVDVCGKGSVPRLLYAGRNGRYHSSFPRMDDLAAGKGGDCTE